MATKKLPTVDIQGKEYVLVKDRIIEFHNRHKTGAIKTELLSDPTSDHIVMKAYIYPNFEESKGYYTGHASEDIGSSMINKKAALENCETSAVGRALAMMGIGVIDSIASADEVRKVAPPGGNLDEAPPVLTGNITQRQADTLKGTMVSRGIKTAADAKIAFKLWAGREVEHANELTKQEASDMIGKLKELDMQSVLSTLIAEKAEQMDEEPF